jgi:c-di-GMP-binding flagellar brake protein YcgR
MLSNLLGRLFGNGQQATGGSSRHVKHRVSDIGELLKLYQAENHLLTLSLKIDNDGSKKAAKMSTGIIEVDARQRRFATDPLIPANANPLLTPGSVAILSLSHHGIRHQFECLWQSSEGSGDQLRHWFEFPKGIEQVQLRDAFRVKLSQAHPIKVALTHAEKPHLTGTIADLSASGMRVRVAGLIQPKPGRGEQYTSCHFVLSDGQPVVCTARLMHWLYDSDPDVTYLGIQFEHLDGATQRALNRYLTDVQRKQRM